jgi:hypothetical protein
MARQEDHSVTANCPAARPTLILGLKVSSLATSRNVRSLRAAALSGLSRDDRIKPNCDVHRPDLLCSLHVDSGRSASERIYKPRRGLNDISVLSSFRDGRSLSPGRAVNLANAGLIDGLWLRIGRGPLSYATPD